MNVPSISTGAIKLLSGLANNDDSIIPMAVKDTISNCAIVATYKKDGGKDDARERAIEEFGTGIFWLFGIPAVKWLFDKTLYPLLKLNSNFDIRNLKGRDNKAIGELAQKVAQAAKDNSALKEEANVFSSLTKNNEVLVKLKLHVTNKDLYKGLFGARFVASTAISAFALAKIIKYKQKTTQQRIERDYIKNNASGIFMNKNIKNSEAYNTFMGNLENKKSKSNTPSFTGLGEAFMYNPILNTLILDGVITSTRLKEARKGERKEVFLKEAFQIVFIYCLAKPIQFAFEKLGKRINLPIGLDPEVIFDKNIVQKAEAAAKIIKEQNLLEDKNIVDTIRTIANNTSDNPLIELLSKDKVINIVQDKQNSKKAMSYLSYVDEGQLKKSLANIRELASSSANMSGIKAYKVIATLGNIVVGALAMGILQPKINILMRKLLNNGDNRNPAIVAQEENLKQKMMAAHQG